LINNVALPRRIRPSCNCRSRRKKCLGAAVLALGRQSD
jgi:hypothetical protein